MIKIAKKGDLNAVVQLAELLWGSHSREELAEELSGLLTSDDARIFIKYGGEDPVGFAQCQLRRDYVEGTSSSPAGYLEGIFVREEYRGKGFAAELLAKCEDWARQRGCTEFASDCELENEESLRFHMAAGFNEANRIICFVKKL